MHGNAWKCIEMYGNVLTVQACLEVYRNVWECMDMFGNAWKSMEMHGNAWDCMKTYEILWACMQLTEMCANVKKSVGTLRNFMETYRNL